jgi:hypothetical protein
LHATTLLDKQKCNVSAIFIRSPPQLLDITLKPQASATPQTLWHRHSRVLNISPLSLPLKAAKYHSIPK